jgi:hypothetical protein
MLKICIEDLPPSVFLIAQTIGIEKCLKIIDHFGGSRIHFPAKGLRSNHPIREILPDADCIALSKYFLGTIDIPRARSAKAAAVGLSIWQDRRNGLTLRELSSKYSLCERQINNIIKKQRERISQPPAIQEDREETKQLSLF